MKKCKFTSGPWSIYDDGDNADSSHIVMAQIDGENYDVCYIATELPIKERTANSKLIAAAPEMLGAIECAVKMLELLPSSGTNSDLSIGLMIVALKNTIKIATGE